MKQSSPRQKPHPSIPEHDGHSHRKSAQKHYRYQSRTPGTTTNDCVNRVCWKSLLVGLGVGRQPPVVGGGSQNNRMTSRAWKRHPLRSRVGSALRSPPESARVLSPSERFLNVCFWHFFGKKVSKPFSSKAYTDIQPTLNVKRIQTETSKRQLFAELGLRGCESVR